MKRSHSVRFVFFNFLTSNLFSALSLVLRIFHSRACQALSRFEFRILCNLYLSFIREIRVIRGCFIRANAWLKHHRSRRKCFFRVLLCATFCNFLSFYVMFVHAFNRYFYRWILTGNLIFGLKTRKITHFAFFSSKNPCAGVHFRAVQFSKPKEQRRFPPGGDLKS